MDPPFNSKANYNVIFKTKNNEDSPSQIQAFEDTWHWSTGETAKEYDMLVKGGGSISEVIQALQNIVGAKSDLLAYLTMMGIRLKEMHRVLKDTGSLYLHCDPTASHYLKLILDALFGVQNFRNEIIWQRASDRAKGSQYNPKTLGSNHDTILFYTKSDDHYFNGLYQDIIEQDLKKKFPLHDENGDYNTDVPIFRSPSMGERPNLCYTYKNVSNPHSSGWRISLERLKELDSIGKIIWRKNKTPLRKTYAHEYKGKPIGDIWIDIPNLTTGKERMGYPTQKPVALLERIIKTSSNEADVILDPFCGCGTAIVAAQRLNRNWIGIDITSIASVLMEERMRKEFDIKIQVKGLPVNYEDALHLFMLSALDFERWAATRIDGIYPTPPTRDKGIDGIGYLGPKGEYKTIISVKGGKNLNPGMVRDLIGTVTSEKATFGVLITIHPPTKGMLDESSQGFVDVGLDKFPKIQIYTISDYFNERKPELP